MTSSVEKNEIDSDDDICDMFEIYEQHILWIINKKKHTHKRGDLHTSHEIADQNHSNMNNEK